MSEEKKENQISMIESHNDWMIEELVDWANLGVANIGISILVNGTIVSGRLIGAKEYYYLYGKQWKDSVTFSDNKTANEFEKKWQKTGDEIDQKLKNDMKEKGEIDPPKFIHLKEAKIVSGTMIFPSNNGMLWRGKISEINGFSLGSLESG